VHSLSSRRTARWDGGSNVGTTGSTGKTRPDEPNAVVDPLLAAKREPAVRKRAVDAHD